MRRANRVGAPRGLGRVLSDTVDEGADAEARQWMPASGAACS
ncbi:hypothetical protein [Streptomyces sp. Tu6071]|nr:hypothetical protein [Streptomyces sp. Tu6071]